MYIVYDYIIFIILGIYNIIIIPIYDCIIINNSQQSVFGYYRLNLVSFV